MNDTMDVEFKVESYSDLMSEFGDGKLRRWFLSIDCWPTGFLEKIPFPSYEECCRAFDSLPLQKHPEDGRMETSREMVFRIQGEPGS